MPDIEKSDKKTNKYPHSGHRDRMKKRLLKKGGKDFSDVELLEMLLYYALPRCDTKKQAEELIKNHGDINSVLNARNEEIRSVSGLKDSTEVLFALLRETIYRAAEGELPFSILDYGRIKSRILNLYKSLDRETVYAFYFNPDGIFISDQIVFHGGISSARFSLRTITERAIRLGSASVILAHNHPSGSLVPSNDDIISTKRIAAHLAANDIELAEHYIVAKDDCVGIMNMI